MTRAAAAATAMVCCYLGSCRLCMCCALYVCVCAVCVKARRLVTLVDLVYEAHTLHPGAVQLCVSAEVPPHQLFLPLLGAAGGSISFRELLVAFGRSNCCLTCYRCDRLGFNSLPGVDWAGQELCVYGAILHPVASYTALWLH